MKKIRCALSSGTVIRKWSLDYFEHFPDQDTRVCDLCSSLRVDTHGVHLTPKGEIVFNYEYCGTVKLDPCGGLIWRISKPTHHSLVPAGTGGYWLLGREAWLASEYPDRFPPFSTLGNERPIMEDTLLRINKGGQLIEYLSIPQVMRDDGLEAC